MDTDRISLEHFKSIDSTLIGFGVRPTHTHTETVHSQNSNDQKYSRRKRKNCRCSCDECKRGEMRGMWGRWRRRRRPLLAQWKNCANWIMAKIVMRSHLKMAQTKEPEANVFIATHKCSQQIIEICFYLLLLVFYCVRFRSCTRFTVSRLEFRFGYFTVVYIVRDRRVICSSCICCWFSILCFATSTDFFEMTRT